MKKLLALFLSGIMMTSSVCLPTSALSKDTVSEYEYSQTELPTAGQFEDFEYSINGDRSAVTILRYIGTDEYVIVPEEIESIPVTMIGVKAFYYNEFVKDVDLPESILYLRESCFYGCENLETIDFPEGLIEVGDFAFTECSSLKRAALPKSLERLSNGAFGLCPSLTELSIDPENEIFVSDNNVIYNKDKSVLVTCAGGKQGDFVVPDSVTQIADRAFLGCASLTGVTLAPNILSLGEDSFYGCSSLNNMNFNDGLKSIGYRAFTFCTSLASISLPDSVETLADNAFSHNYTLTGVIHISKNLTSIGRCAFMNTSVTEFEADPENPVYSILDGCIYSKDLKTIIVYPGGKSGIYEIPDGVERIEDNAFSGSLALTGAVIPDSVTYVGRVAFGHCENLDNIQFGKNIEFIGDSAFSSTKLHVAELPDSVKTIGTFAFVMCNELTEVVISRSISRIEIGTFWWCYNLQKVTIYENVTYIEDEAFKDDEKVVIYGYSGSYAETYANDHFIRFVDLNEVPETDTDTDTDIPELYGDVNNDGKVTAKDAMTVQRYAIKLEELSDAQLAAADVDLDGNITAKDALYILRCSINLEVLPIDPIVYDDTETETDFDEDILTSGDYSYYLYNEDQIVLCNYNGSDRDVVVPSQLNGNDVMSIGSGTFFDCDCIENVTISNGIRYLGYFSFKGCDNLVSVYIPASIEDIQFRSFDHCKSLERFTVSEQNKEYSSFDDVLYTKDKYYLLQCPAVKNSVKIPKSVINISSIAFLDCDNLTDVYYEGDEEDWNKIDIRDLNSNLTNATIHFNSNMSD